MSPLSPNLLVWTRGATSPFPSQGTAPAGALLCIAWRLSLAFLNQRFLVSDWGQWELLNEGGAKPEKDPLLKNYNESNNGWVLEQCLRMTIVVWRLP